MHTAPKTYQDMGLETHLKSITFTVNCYSFLQLGTANCITSTRINYLSLLMSYFYLYITHNERGSGGSALGSGVLGAAAPSGVQGAEPLAGVNCRITFFITILNYYLIANSKFKG